MKRSKLAVHASVKTLLLIGGSMQEQSHIIFKASWKCTLCTYACVRCTLAKSVAAPPR